MKKPCNYSVIYHGDGQSLWNAEEGLYRKIIEHYRKQLHKHEIELIHLSPDGHEGWGDINIHYPGDIKEPMWNREVFFNRFLEEDAKDGEYYWFGEPDVLIKEMFPPTDCDVALLIRPHDLVRICPAFRLAKKTALPYFKAIKDNFLMTKKAWHGDSDAHAAIGKQIENAGKLQIHKTNWLGISMEFREYRDYVHPGKYLRHFKYKNKEALLDLIESENENRNA